MWCSVGKKKRNKKRRAPGKEPVKPEWNCFRAHRLYVGFRLAADGLLLLSVFLSLMKSDWVLQATGLTVLAMTGMMMAAMGLTCPRCGKPLYRSIALTALHLPRCCRHCGTVGKDGEMNVSGLPDGSKGAGTLPCAEKRTAKD